MAAKIRPVQVTRSDADAARDLHVDFLKLAPSRDFETSSRAVKKLEGASLRKHLYPHSLTWIHKEANFIIL